MATRKEQRQKKYELITNYTGNAKLAQQARDWSYDRIYVELGIQVKKKPRKVKAVKKIDRKQLQQQVETKEKYLRRKGVDEELVNTLKYRTYSQINKEIEYRKTYVKPKKEKVSFKEKKQRIEQWSDWSEHETYPYSIKRMAHLINLKSNLDINASYGFGMVYFAFTTNKDPEHFIRQYQYDRHTGEIIYRTTS